MANAARPRPDMPAPQPVEATKVSEVSSDGKRAARSLGSSGEAGDQIFKFAMLLVRSGCAGNSGPDRLRIGAALRAFLARIWIQVLCRARLGSGKRTIRRAAVHLRNPGFVAARSDHCGAALDWGRGIHHRDVPQGAARAAIFFRGIAGCHSERCLRAVGDLCAGADPQQLC